MLKEILVAVISSVISGIILILIGYLLVIKENKIAIQYLKEDFIDLKETAKETQASLNETKLFIARAHPDRDASKLSSLEKLKKLSSSELEQLAVGLELTKDISKEELPETDTSRPFRIDELKTAEEKDKKAVCKLIDKYKLDKKDIKAYADITRTSYIPTYEDKSDPYALWYVCKSNGEPKTQR